MGQGSRQLGGRERENDRGENGEMGQGHRQRGGRERKKEREEVEMENWTRAQTAIAKD